MRASRGSVLHWHEKDGVPVLALAELVGRVAASLREVRRSRELSQQDLAGLAGVTASAISQAEREERGLSLATLVRLSSALGRHDRRPPARRGSGPLPDRAPDRGPPARARANDHAARRWRRGPARRPRAPRRARGRRARRSAKGHRNRRRRQRSRARAGRRSDPGSSLRRGARRRQRTDRGMAQSRADRGGAVLDRHPGRARNAPTPARVTRRAILFLAGQIEPARRSRERVTTEPPPTRLGFAACRPRISAQLRPQSAPLRGG